MHIYFSGIGGTAIGPLALIAKQAGYQVSGSDQQDSLYVAYLRKQGIDEIQIGQTTQQIADAHARQPIDWLVRSSAVPDDSPELVFAKENGIKTSKRDELLNKIIDDKQLKLVAVAGTHGKSTTTALLVWLFKQLKVPVSYSVGAKISFGEMGEFDPSSQFFVYECDEFDRNFLAFNPFVSIISGLSWDHHEIFPTKQDYQQAFRDFIKQTEWLEIWKEDFDQLKLEPSDHYAVMDSTDPGIDALELPGHYNRLDAWLAVKAVQQLTQRPLDKIIELVNRFPGLQRRMERLAPGLYTDYAHTPEKVRGGLSAALDIAKGRPVVVLFEPLHNRRQHFMIDQYKDCFQGATKLYWLPSYLAREDPSQRIIPPQEMIDHLDDPSIGVPAERNDDLKAAIQKHLDAGDMVVGMAGGGGDSLDEWLRAEFVSS